MLRFRPREGTAAWDSVERRRQQLSRAARGDGADAEEDDQTSGSDGESSDRSRRSASPLPEAIVVVKSFRINKLTPDGNKLKVVVKAGEDEAIGYLYPTGSTTDASKALLDSIRDSQAAVISRVNTIVQRRKIDDGRFRRLGLQAVSDVMSEAIKAAVPGAGVTSLASFVRQQNDGPAKETVVICNVASVAVKEKSYFPLAEKVHPYGTSLTPKTVASSPSSIPFSPGRIIYRLDPEILARFHLPTLAISNSATLTQVVPHHTDHLPVRWLTRRVGWQGADASIDCWRLDEDTQATLRNKWQVRKLQEAHREAIAGVAPDIVAQNFYAGFNDPEIAPVALPVFVKVTSKGSNETRYLVGLSKHTHPKCPRKTVDSERKAIDAAKDLTSKICAAAARPGMPQANRAKVEKEETLIKISTEWYDGFTQRVDINEAEALLGGTQMSRLLSQGDADVCGAEYCPREHHLCKCEAGRHGKRGALHKGTHRFPCSEMVAERALIHITAHQSGHLRERAPLGFNATYIARKDEGCIIIDAPIESLDDALAIPGTLFDHTTPQAVAATVDALADAIAASETRIDDELAETAAAWLDIPVEVFYLTPLDDHETCTARVVATIATALGQSLDVVIQLDEREGPPVIGRLGHSSYSSRRIPTYMQKKKSRNLYIVAIAMQALLLRTAGLADEIPRLDAVLLAVRPIDVAYPAGSSRDVPALDDEKRALAREMTAMIEVAAPLETPALVRAIQRVDDEDAAYPRPSAIKLAERYARTFVKEKWADEHCIDDDEQKARIKALIRRCRADAARFEELCDATTDLGAAWVERVAEIEDYYGGERKLPKTELGWPKIWFEDDEPIDICWLAHVVLSRGLFDCNKDGTAACGGVVAVDGEDSQEGSDDEDAGSDVEDVDEEDIDETDMDTDSGDGNGDGELSDGGSAGSVGSFDDSDDARLVIMIIMEAWIVHYLQHGHRDALLLLILDLSGDLSSFKPCLAARKDHSALLWDGRLNIPVEELQYMNITVQPCILNQLLAKRPITSLGAIHASLRKPIADMMESQRAMGQVDWSQGSIAAVRNQGILNGEILEMLRGNGWLEDDVAAWNAKRAGQQGVDDESGSGSDADMGDGDD